MTPRRNLLAMSCAVLMAFTAPACTKSSAPLAPTPATPTPTPASSPTPVAFSCPLPPSHKDDPNACYVGRPTLGRQVNSAIDTVIATRPELFNLNDLAGGNPRVLDRDAYWLAVKHELESQGVCTLIEKEEFAVKTTNAFNEQWNTWASSGAANCTRDTCLGFVRRHYASTCEPSWF